MNTITCAVCGATLQTPGDVCADAVANGWEVMDGGARCKKCRMAGNSGKISFVQRFFGGLPRWKDCDLTHLETIALNSPHYTAITLTLGREDILSLIAEVRAARAAGKD